MALSSFYAGRNIMNIKEKKSYWRKPEGVVGIILISVLGIAFLTVLWFLLSLAIAGNVLAVTALLAIMGITVLCFLDNPMRTFIKIAFHRISKWCASWFIDVDPMKVLHRHVAEMEFNLKQLKRQITALKGQTHKLTEQVMNNKKQIDLRLQEAAQAKEINEEASIIINTRRAARLRNSNDKLSGLLDRMINLNKVLERMKGHSIIMITDIKDTIDIKEKERNAIVEGNGAMKSALLILSGGNDQKEEFDSALELVADDIAIKLSEMEDFMAMSAQFMRKIDLNNNVSEIEGLEMLEKFEKENAAYIRKLERTDNPISMDSSSGEIERTAHRSRNVNTIENQYDTLFNFDNKKTDG